MISKYILKIIKDYLSSPLNYLDELIDNTKFIYEDCNNWWTYHRWAVDINDPREGVVGKYIVLHNRDFSDWFIGHKIYQR
jgi:hypothetical protein